MTNEKKPSLSEAFLIGGRLGRFGPEGNAIGFAVMVLLGVAGLAKVYFSGGQENTIPAEVRGNSLQDKAMASLAATMKETKTIYLIHHIVGPKAIDFRQELGNPAWLGVRIDYRTQNDSGNWHDDTELFMFDDKGDLIKPPVPNTGAAKLEGESW